MIHNNLGRDTTYMYINQLKTNTTAPRYLQQLESILPVKHEADPHITPEQLTLAVIKVMTLRELTRKTSKLG